MTQPPQAAQRSSANTITSPRFPNGLNSSSTPLPLTIARGAFLSATSSQPTPSSSSYSSDQSGLISFLELSDKYLRAESRTIAVQQMVRVRDALKNKAAVSLEDKRVVLGIFGWIALMAGVSRDMISHIHKEHSVDLRDFDAVSAALEKSFAATSMKDSVQFAMSRKTSENVAFPTACGPNGRASGAGTSNGTQNGVVPALIKLRNSGRRKRARSPEPTEDSGSARKTDRRQKKKLSLTLQSFNQHTPLNKSGVTIKSTDASADFIDLTEEHDIIDLTQDESPPRPSTVAISRSNARLSSPLPSSQPTSLLSEEPAHVAVISMEVEVEVEGQTMDVRTEPSILVGCSGSTSSALNSAGPAAIGDLPSIIDSSGTENHSTSIGDGIASAGESGSRSNGKEPAPYQDDLSDPMQTDQSALSVTADAIPKVAQGVSTSSPASRQEDDLTVYHHGGTPVCYSSGTLSSASTPTSGSSVIPADQPLVKAKATPVVGCSVSPPMALVPSQQILIPALEWKSNPLVTFRVGASSKVENRPDYPPIPLLMPQHLLPRVRWDSVHSLWVCFFVRAQWGTTLPPTVTAVPYWDHTTERWCAWPTKGTKALQWEKEDATWVLIDKGQILGKPLPLTKDPIYTNREAEPEPGQEQPVYPLDNLRMPGRAVYDPMLALWRFKPNDPIDGLPNLPEMPSPTMILIVWDIHLGKWKVAKQGLNAFNRLVTWEVETGTWQAAGT